MGCQIVGWLVLYRMTMSLLVPAGCWVDSLQVLTTLLMLLLLLQMISCGQCSICWRA
jgi:hypothetical protein